MNSIFHPPSTKMEGVAPLCLGEQLPPPCDPDIVILAVGVVECLIFSLVVMENVNVDVLLGAWCGREAEGDSPHTSYGNCEHS